MPELTALSQQFGLQLLHANDSDDSDDRLGRTGVSWSTAVLGLPDDGLGALPLLRHLVLVDEKSSTQRKRFRCFIRRNSADLTGAHVNDIIEYSVGSFCAIGTIASILGRFFVAFAGMELNPYRYTQLSRSPRASTVMRWRHPSHAEALARSS